MSKRWFALSDPSTNWVNLSAGPEQVTSVTVRIINQAIFISNAPFISELIFTTRNVFGDPLPGIALQDVSISGTSVGENYDQRGQVTDGNGDLVVLVVALIPGDSYVTATFAGVTSTQAFVRVATRNYYSSQDVRINRLPFVKSESLRR